MLSRVRQSLALAVAAGVMIGIGGTIYLKLGGLYGAVLFSVALLTICTLGLHLFTGKVGALVYSEHKCEDAFLLFTCLIGNFIGTFVSAVMTTVSSSELAPMAYDICTSKLERAPLSVLFSAFLCGILMYVAVSVYLQKKSIVGIVFCIPVFILSGYEHSIADAYYFFAASLYGTRTFVFLLIVVAGNALGAWFVPIMKKVAGVGEW